MDWAHTEEDRRMYYKEGIGLESTGQEEKRKTKRDVEKDSG